MEEKQKMKTSRDSNNNYSKQSQQNFSSSASPSTNNTRQNLMTSKASVHHQNSTTTMNSDAKIYSSFTNQNNSQQSTMAHFANDQCATSYNTQQPTSISRSAMQHNDSMNSRTFRSSSNSTYPKINDDPNHQLSSIVQAYLMKCNGNQTFQPDAINPLSYLQLMNTNTALTQPLLSNQSNTTAINNDPIKYPQVSSYLHNLSLSSPNVDIAKERTQFSRSPQQLQTDSTIFVPKTRPMTQNEIAEHARLVYQRALQRNQIQHHNELVKHLYVPSNVRQSDVSLSLHTATNFANAIRYHEVPRVPKVGNTAVGASDLLDTLIEPPSSCLSQKEPSISATLSSVSLVSTDDVKISTSAGSTLDPAAPIFIPCQSRSKLDDDDDETSSTSSDSDFNDFHYLDQFLNEFYNLENKYDNHVVVQKPISTEIPNTDDEILNNKSKISNSKHNVDVNVLGQGDAILEQVISATTNEDIEQNLSATAEKVNCHYTIHELLHRYRNPRCHLILPEWSRLSLILPNVCSMRAQTYKLKRYFAYRRRLHTEQTLNKDLNSNVSVYG